MWVPLSWPGCRATRLWPPWRRPERVPSSSSKQTCTKDLCRRASSRWGWMLVRSLSSSITQERVEQFSWKMVPKNVNKRRSWSSDDDDDDDADDDDEADNNDDITDTTRKWMNVTTFGLEFAFLIFDWRTIFWPIFNQIRSKSRLADGRGLKLWLKIFQNLLRRKWEFFASASLTI